MAGALLSSCNSRNDSEAPVDYGLGEQAGRQEDKFGKGFGKAFRAHPNSEPANVSEGDVKPVSYTAQPELID